MLFYLDSSSASVVTQAVVAGAAGVAVVAKTQWRRITSPFRKKDDDATTIAETAPASSWDTPGGES
jgi:hypothetical protein